MESETIAMEKQYLRRKIDSYLREWKKQEDRLPLIIRGSRQVGKTMSVRHFASSSNYESFIEINFVEEEKYKKIIQDGYSAKDIVRNISFLDPSKKFIPGKTLIFFDEITDFPEIATSLKFFKEDGRFDVICSGSMLGLNYRRIESNSVGYKMDYEMLSMDFEEFLYAKGYSEADIADMIFHMKEGKPFSDLEMHIYQKLFIDYAALGGMPGIVKEYIQKDTFENSLFRQRQLLSDYKEDIRKYASGVDQTRILNVFESIPNQLAKENKKFQISKIRNGARFADYRGCIEWLCDAGVVNMCRALNFPELPLRGNCDSDKFKLYFADTGLLISCLDDEAQEDFRENRNLGVYKGGLYENIIAEALFKSGYPLYYYKREDGTLEEDFFIRSKTSLIPIEVKAKGGKSKSLRTLIDSDRFPDIRYGFKLSMANIYHENKVYGFPYFCGFLLKRLMKDFVPAEEKAAEAA